MQQLTPEGRADLIAAIAIRRRMAANAVRQAEHDAAVSQRAQARGGRVVISPGGMAHVAPAGAGLQPICVHRSDGESKGWVAADYTWDAVPPGVACCKTCVSRF